MEQPSNQSSKQGLLYGFLAYLMWGLAPVFFKLLENVPTYEVISHRVIWSMVLLVIIITINRNWGHIVSIIKMPKLLLGLLFTSVLIACNWTIYVWGIANGHVLEASLGYFICPLSSILLGIIFFKERFRPLQWTAIALATIGILIQLWIFGSFPKIAIGLALTFSFYGLFRKKINVDAMSGLFIETVLLLPVALIYLTFFTQGSTTSNIFKNTTYLNLLFISAGFVTTIPLILFNSAALRVKLSVLGLIQYIGPTLIFLLAVLVYKEQVGMDKLITFAFIWTGILLFIWDGLKNMGNKQTTK